jgi:protein-disulfide isomerase
MNRTGRSFTRAMTLVISIAIAVTASAKDITRAELKKALDQNPDILVEAIKNNAKTIFAMMVQTAAEEQARVQKEAEEAERKAYEDSFKTPLIPVVDAQTRIRGATEAKYTLVEYADFECPYCATAHDTVEELRKRYGNDLRFVFKHLPLPFHSRAMPAAQWLEAVAIESPEAAWRFHDILFANQEKLDLEFFQKTAAGLGLDVKKIENLAASQIVKDRIAADIDEANRFGFNGTPAFLLNGIPVRGAYPVDRFADIIARLGGKIAAP